MRRPFPSPRGSALLVAMILLLVLSLIGAAAVRLSSQERNNAETMTRVQFLNACANAAQAKIWAEMSQYGLGYLGSSVQVTPMVLPDGTTLVGPAHYDTLSAPPSGGGSGGGAAGGGGAPDPGAYPQVKDVTFKVETTAASGAINERDCTNGGCGIVPLGQTNGMTALCTDAKGRSYEIELAVKFAL